MFDHVEYSTIAEKTLEYVYRYKYLLSHVSDELLDSFIELELEIKEYGIDTNRLREFARINITVK